MQSFPAVDVQRLRSRSRNIPSVIALRLLPSPWSGIGSTPRTGCQWERGETLAVSLYDVDERSAIEESLVAAPKCSGQRESLVFVRRLLSRGMVSLCETDWSCSDVEE